MIGLGAIDQSEKLRQYVVDGLVLLGLSGKVHSLIEEREDDLFLLRIRW